MDRYHELLKELVDHPPIREKYHLRNMQLLQKALGFPDRSFLSVHVAGTNGKGSVATKIAEALRLSGLCTGLYTSPHVSSFRERICVDGAMIAKEEMVLGMEKLLSLSKSLGLTLSFFELMTLLCFEYFARVKVDVAVIEVGLGGRLDATNVIFPILSVITSVRLDHTELLGNRIDQIAKEKAGIIKRRVPLILGPKAHQKIIRKQAQRLESPMIFVSEEGPYFDEEDRRIALSALKELQKRFSLEEEHIQSGLNMRPKCRFEVVNESAPFAKNFPHFPKAIVFDVAHNPDGFRSLLKTWRYFYSDQKPRVICGMSKDKDIDRCMQVLAKMASHVHLVRADHKRLAFPKDIAQLLKKSAFEEISVEKNLTEGVRNGFSLSSQKKELLLVCGSFFIMKDVRKALHIEEERDE